MSKDPLDLFPKRQEGKLNIYFHVSENTGVGYYRQYLPAWTLREQKLANVMISDFKWGEGPTIEPALSTLYPIMIWADLVVVGRRDLPEFYAQWGGVKEHFNLPIIMDTDDNVYHVRPENPGYQGYYPGSPGQIINKYATMRVFDAITVSTEDLRDFHKRDNPRIHVMPNNLDMADWDKYSKKKFDDGFIRMGFIGSGAHTNSIMIMKKAIVDIMVKYPNVKFCITHIFRHLFSDAPKEVQERIEYLPWIKLEEWGKGSKEVGLDIGLAPLADNMFNRSKSNLRWMEYAAAKVAPVVSPVKPYLCVKNNVTGIFAKEKEEWYNAIERLILDPKLRNDIAENAYKEVSSKYDIVKNIKLWDNVYREIHEKYHQFFGAKKQFLSLGKGKYRQIK